MCKKFSEKVTKKVHKKFIEKSSRIQADSAPTTTVFIWTDHSTRKTQYQSQIFKPLDLKPTYFTSMTATWSTSGKTQKKAINNERIVDFTTFEGVNLHS